MAEWTAQWTARFVGKLVLVAAHDMHDSSSVLPYFDESCIVFQNRNTREPWEKISHAGHFTMSADLGLASLEVTATMGSFRYSIPTFPPSYLGTNLNEPFSLSNTFVITHPLKRLCWLNSSFIYTMSTNRIGQ